MYLIDSHAHIYLPEFEADRMEMLNRASKAGVRTILMPAIDSSTHGAMLDLEQMQIDSRPMMGLHPCSVKEDFLKELAVVKAYLDKRKFIAIGEIGLDFYWDKTFTDQQFHAFRQQIEWAVEHDLPVSIHSRNATDECIEVIRGYSTIRGVFHCFSGNEQQARELIEKGFYLGIGGVVTFKNSGLDKVLESVEMNNIILETDAPYLAPVPFRGKRNEPSYLTSIVAKLVMLFTKTEEEVMEITTNNAKQLFKL